MPDDPAAPARERLEEQAAEYGEYIAISPINIDGVRAFNVGDPVPKSHVDGGVVDKDSVARRTTKAAQAATNPEG